MFRVIENVNKDIDSILKVKGEFTYHCMLGGGNVSHVEYELSLELGDKQMEYESFAEWVETFSDKQTNHEELTRYMLDTVKEKLEPKNASLKTVNLDKTAQYELEIK